MAFSASAPTCSYFSQFQSSSTFKLRPLLLNHARPSIRWARVRVVSASVNAALDSGNGALLAAEKPDHAIPNYGRRYFPLAAVVGQVNPLCLSVSLSIMVLWFVNYVFLMN